jgi:hypothetical protein
MEGLPIKGKRRSFVTAANGQPPRSHCRCDRNRKDRHLAGHADILAASAFRFYG